MRIYLNRDADEAYLALPGHPRQPGCVHQTAPVVRNTRDVLIYADFDQTGHLIGIEVCNATAHVPSELLQQARPFAATNRPNVYRWRDFQAARVAWAAQMPGQLFPADETPEMEATTVAAEDPITAIRARYDPTVDAGYIELSGHQAPEGSVASSIPLDLRVFPAMIVFDLDANDLMIGIEVLGAKALFTPELMRLAVPGRAPEP